MLGDEIVHTEKKAQKKEKKAMSVSLYGNLISNSYYHKLTSCFA